MRIFYKTLFLILSISVFSFAQTNIVSNGGFEDWASGLPNHWFGVKSNIAQSNVNQYSTDVHNGSFATQLINTGSTHKRFTTEGLSVTDGVEYTITFWVRGHGEIRTGLYDDRSTGYGYATYNDYIVVNSATWTQQTQTITAANTVSYAEFIFSSRNTQADIDHIQIDDVEILAPSTNVPQFSNITTGLFDANTPITIEATITDNQGISSAYLHNRINLAAQDDSVQMTNISGDIYQAIISGQGNGTGIEYWISATDTDVPSNYSTSPHYQVMVGITNIEKSHEIDPDGNMLYEGYLVKVRGIVTAATGTFSQIGIDDYIQDLTGGVNIYNSSVIQAMVLGDSVEISGKFDVYNSKSEIVNPIITILNQGNPVPDPIVITISDMGEQYEGMLIQLNQGVVNNWITQPDTNFNATFTTGDGDLTLRVDKDTDIGGHEEPQGIFDLVGIGGQYDSQIPYTDGYQIMPRSWADFLNLNTIEDRISSPYEFTLKQNYPNPFNPNTKIEFSLGATVDVKLIIYNLLGQEIKSFSTQNLKAGVHHFDWNGKDNKGFDVASGIYIYRLTAGDFVSTKKMALLR